MVLDLLWTSGEVLCLVGLLYGAYLVLMETEPFLSLLRAAHAIMRNLAVGRHDKRMISLDW